MDSLELRKLVVSKFDARQDEFNGLVAGVKKFALDILVDCKDVITEIPDAKTAAGIIIDEIDDRTNTGLLDLIDGPIAKGLFEKFVDTPAFETWFQQIRQQALDQIAANTPPPTAPAVGA